MSCLLSLLTERVSAAVPEPASQPLLLAPLFGGEAGSFGGDGGALFLSLCRLLPQVSTDCTVWGGTTTDYTVWGSAYSREEWASTLL